MPLSPGGPQRVPVTISEQQSQLLLKHSRCERVWPPIQSLLTKHSPSHGDANSDSHITPSRNEAPINQLPWVGQNLHTHSWHGATTCQVRIPLRWRQLPHLKTRTITRHKQCKLLVSIEIARKGEGCKQFCCMYYGTGKQLSLHSILVPSLSSPSLVLGVP